jgi:Flp pilus assembly protein TadD
LARAAKARGGDGGGAAAAPASVSRRRGGGGFRRLLIILVVLIVAAGAVYEFFGDEIVSTVTVIVFGEPTPPPPPPKKTAVAVAPKLQPGFAQNSAPVAPTTQPAPATANSAPTPVSPAPAPSASGAAGTTATSVAPVASAPPSGAAPVAVAQAPAPVAAAPPPTALTADASPTPLSAPATKGTAPQPAKATAVTSEQDLPAILDRIRQQHAKASLQPSAVVDRTSTALAMSIASDAPGSVGSMVSVEAAPQQQRDDTEHAYDMLLHGQYEGALALYDSVLKTVPDSVAALLGKAIALHKLRRLGEARPLYQRVLAIDPSNREALTNMMSIIASQSPAAALSELRDLQKTYPTFSPIPAQIAQIDAQTGNPADAISSLNRAIQLSPENGLYRLDLAIIQDRAGMTKEAAASYGEALDRLGAGAQLPIPIESIRARFRYLRSR